MIIRSVSVLTCVKHLNSQCLRVWRRVQLRYCVATFKLFTIQNKETAKQSAEVQAAFADFKKQFAKKGLELVKGTEITFVWYSQEQELRFNTLHYV